MLTNQPCALAPSRASRQIKKQHFHTALDIHNLFVFLEAIVLPAMRLSQGEPPKRSIWQEPLCGRLSHCQSGSVTIPARSRPVPPRPYSDSLSARTPSPSVGIRRLHARLASALRRPSAGRHFGSTRDVS